MKLKQLKQILTRIVGEHAVNKNFSCFVSSPYSKFFENGEVMCMYGKHAGLPFHDEESAINTTDENIDTIMIRLNPSEGFDYQAELDLGYADSPVK